MSTGQKLYPEFQEELRVLLNRHNIDNAVNTPDFILAGTLCEVIETIRKTNAAHTAWHREGLAADAELPGERQRDYAGITGKLIADAMGGGTIVDIGHTDEGRPLERREVRGDWPSRSIRDDPQA